MTNGIKKNSNSFTKTPDDYVGLLKQLIQIPSVSKEESNVADYLYSYFKNSNIVAKRHGNNLIINNLSFNDQKLTILINSHIDTVKPNSSYTRDPFVPVVEGGKLYGLGSNDAGGCLVGLIYAFEKLYSRSDMRYNLVLVISAEEEISGENGITSLVDMLLQEYNISFGMIGEPTLLQPAIAEKGLMVLDVIVNGVAGHAARDEGKNAIYLSLPVVDYFQNFKYETVSKTLGSIKATVSVINAGQQHNIVPDRCAMTVDVRTTDVIGNDELLSIFQWDLLGLAMVQARSTRLNPSSIPVDHPFVTALVKRGCIPFGSPTLSDQALLPFPTLKVGPGDSSRSHTADEYIFVAEVTEGCLFYESVLLDFLVA